MRPTITLYRKKGNTTVEEVRFSIRYVAQKADEDHPTIGEHPPPSSPIWTA